MSIEARRRIAGLTSTTGALLLGAGLGALFPDALADGAAVLVVLGVVLHGWGMFDARRLERAGAPAAWWAVMAYWGCWLALGAVLAWLLTG